MACEKHTKAALWSESLRSSHHRNAEPLFKRDKDFLIQRYLSWGRMSGIPSLKPVGLVDQVYLKGKQNNVLPAGNTTLPLEVGTIYES